MVQVNLYLSPTALTQIRQPLQQAAMVLFGRIEVRVNECMTVAVAEAVEIARIFSSPTIESLLLHVLWRVSGVMSRDAARFEMVAHGNDQVQPPAGISASQSLPRVSGKALRGIVQLPNHLDASPRSLANFLHFD